MKLEKEHFMWIIEDGARLESPVAIKRAFVRRFKMSPRAAKNLRPQQLMEVITRFRNTGSVSPEKGPEARQKRARTAENVAKVRDHFAETPRTSLRKYSHVLAIKKTSLRN